MTIQSMLLLLDGIGFKVFSTLLSLLWQSSIMLLAAGALVYFLRNRNAAARNAVWVAAMLAIPLLPLLSRGVSIIGSPHTEIAVIPAYDESFGRSAPPAPNMEIQPAHVPVSVPVIGPHGLLDYPYSFALAAYTLVLAALLFWIFIARLRIRRWILDGDPVLDSHVLDAFRSAAARHGLSKEYPVFEHPGVPAPLTCRIVRPVIILPSGFASSLSDAELRSVALHETAHIKRRDTLILTLVSLIRALFFFQPLAWYAARQISYLAEVSCDSAALEHEGNPATYAQLLTRLAFRLPERAPSAELAMGILFTNSAFFKRIRVILSDRSRGLRNLSRRGTVLLSLIFLSTLLTAASLPLAENGTAQTLPEKGSQKRWYDHYFQNFTGSTKSRMEEKIQKASTPEKKAAIDRLLRFWSDYRYNDLSILMCSDMILKADRNIPIIEGIAEYSLKAGSNTMIYIGIAKCAAKSKKASQEFLDLASVVEREGGHLSLIDLARKIERAKNEAELQPLREEIAALK